MRLKIFLFRYIICNKFENLSSECALVLKKGLPFFDNAVANERMPTIFRQVSRRDAAGHFQQIYRSGKKPVALPPGGCPEGVLAHAARQPLAAPRPKARPLPRFAVAAQGGETLLERSVIPNLLHKNKQILVDTAYSPVRFRPPAGAAGDAAVSVLVTQWPLEVRAPPPPLRLRLPSPLSPALASGF